jgi:hypothetical protein
MIKRIAISLAFVGALGALAPSLSSAAPPGPGDKQCVPGHNGPPQPGFKPPPSCPGNNH